MTTEIRRTILNVQATQEEGGKPLESPTKLISALAIIRKPWFGRGFVEDLRLEIREVGPVVGRLLTEMILDITADPARATDHASNSADDGGA